MSAFATLAEYEIIEGVRCEGAQSDRVTALLDIISDLIRSEGSKAGVNVDDKMDTDPAYTSVVKMITCDVTARALRQSTTGEPMSQESRSGLGYTWSGTYAIPGGGIAMSLMNNERKMLGFKRQRYGVMEIWDGSQDEQ